LDITLEIESGRLVDAEVFQGLGNSIAHFLGHPEEMVDGIATGKDNGGIFREFDMFLTEFACRDVIEFDKLLKSKADSILLRYITERCL
jgi:hypothetical protein